MNTVVEFIRTNREKGWRNSLCTWTLQKVGFIDHKHPKDGDYPKQTEHWLVNITRENMAAGAGGCFILKPLRKVPDEDLMPLVVGMYEMDALDGTIIITPNDQTKMWVLSDEAKRSIMNTYNTAKLVVHSLVINQGGKLWPRRKPAESIVESQAKRLLDLTKEGDVDEQG